MRILIASKFWYQRGGLERVLFDEIGWLESEGHEIAHFSTAHPANDPSPWSSYFVPYLELGDSGTLSASAKAIAAARMFSNREAARRFDRLLTDFRPDIVHLHGIHRQISPSILAVARNSGVPVVQTLHDCHHICPADILWNGTGSCCQPRLCGRFWYGPAVTGRCVRGSLSASALSAAETAWQRTWRVYERGIARFISPSRFLAEQMSAARWRIPTDVVPNAVATASSRAGTGSGFVVLGRVSAEKGVEIALAAAREAGVQLTVAGDGPLAAELRAAYPEAHFTGWLAKGEIADLVAGARAVVVPSLACENAPMSVLEAMAVGVPVIASRTGGIPEQIEHGVEGLLVRRGDVIELAAALRVLDDDPATAERMGSHARRRARRVFGPARHTRALVGVYERALGQRETGADKDDEGDLL